jgi:hypothetical protein
LRGSTPRGPTNLPSKLESQPNRKTL